MRGFLHCSSCRTVMLAARCYPSISSATRRLAVGTQGFVPSGTVTIDVGRSGWGRQGLPEMESAEGGQTWGCSEPGACSHQDSSEANKTGPFRVHGGDGATGVCHSRASGHSVLHVQLGGERHETAFSAGIPRAVRPGDRLVQGRTWESPSSGPGVPGPPQARALLPCC